MLAALRTEFQHEESDDSPLGTVFNFNKAMNPKPTPTNKNKIHSTLKRLGVIASLVLQDGYKGMRDGINFPLAVNFFASSGTLRKLFAQCFVLNGLIFMGSLVVLDTLIPLLVNSSSYNEVSKIDFCLSNVLYEITKYLLWILPLYSISFILSGLWYNDISVKAYQMSHPPTGQISSTHQQQDPYLLRRGIVARITDELYRLPLFLFILAQSALFGLIPMVGPLLAFLQTSLLYAFYSFDYVWGQKAGVTLKKRIAYFERHWAYMCGFGIPNALASYFFPFFMGAGMYAFLFPFFIVLAVDKETKVPKVSKDMPCLPMFAAAKVLNEKLLKLFSKKPTQHIEESEGLWKGD